VLAVGSHHEQASEQNLSPGFPEGAIYGQRLRPLCFDVKGRSSSPRLRSCTLIVNKSGLPKPTSLTSAAGISSFAVGFPLPFLGKPSGCWCSSRPG
jgi:hypothetical protein